jgi:hypothetical protein
VLPPPPPPPQPVKPKAATTKRAIAGINIFSNFILLHLLLRFADLATGSRATTMATGPVNEVIYKSLLTVNLWLGENSTDEKILQPPILNRQIAHKQKQCKEHSRTV